MSARDVLADQIEKWAGQDSVYDYADRLIKVLDSAGFVIVAKQEQAGDAEEYRALSGQLSDITEECNNLRALVDGLTAPKDEIKCASEREEATAIIEGYLHGGHPPFERWHHIDNARGDLLREIIKQLVARVDGLTAARRWPR